MTDTKLKVDYIGIMETLESRQMILQGPPGTSKTYGAKKIIAEALELNNEISSENDKNLTEKEKINKILSCKLIKDEYDKSARWDMVQFHPSYGYEDFVRGIIVETKEDSSFDTESKEHVISHHIEYNTIDKTFGRICRLAKKNLDDKFFLLIDEINRADVATTLGELIYALENRGEEVTTPYKVKDRDGIESNKICVPKNLYIIGTMNTADKSVGNIDYAIRRRFLFFDLLPNRKTIEDYLMGENNETETWKSEVIMAFDAINYIVEKDLDPTYSPKDFKIGHT